ncbi:MAG: hypothetical protein QY331_07655 [Melioribacteraceae bacterium]|nr:MAG: hypothetical protein QY331_07655 [Melioribacteraceae bacterium]
MDLTNIPSDPFESRLAFLRDGFDIYANLTIEYIQKEYPKKLELYQCLDFMGYSMSETSKSDFETLKRLWFFPTNEAISELNECLHRILEAAYKAGYDNLRRALELIVVGSYFSMSETNEKDAIDWLNSQRGTPLFSRAIKSLLNDNRFFNLEKDTLWVTNLKNFYWYLSDIIHTRGNNYSLEALQPSNFSYNNIRTAQFSKANLKQLLDTFIETFKNICTCIAITNPILLIGLPVDEKYGFDTPVSGFFREHQSNDLWNLLIPETKEYFRNLISTDLELISVSRWMNSLPDKTEEEIERQIEEFKKTINDLKKGN